MHRNTSSVLAFTGTTAAVTFAAALVSCNGIDDDPASAVAAVAFAPALSALITLAEASMPTPAVAPTMLHSWADGQVAAGPRPCPRC